jgi:2,5-diketo-D-gluconate reductase B
MAALAEAKALGLTRQIGVSNFNIELTRQAIAVVGAGEIATNQIELSLSAEPQADRLPEGTGHPVTSYMTLAYGKVLKDPVLTRSPRSTTPPWRRWRWLGAAARLLR